ncbi:hypothetical protein [Streptomyces sp. B1I3]|uniref:hypothetical protein n=1 Tax=Streptomyces sp. B1I3 TaxID=3042264 RepID=UPI002788E9A5|nr:hypothetical protein [Streptomyces sp. B1I3]MDQ0791948.1 hypothetical protein [Streptomyces sp. B1I3]
MPFQPQPVEPPVDETAADGQTLVDMGVIDPPPTPTYAGLFLEPDIPPEPDDAA